MAVLRLYVYTVCVYVHMYTSAADCSVQLQYLDYLCVQSLMCDPEYPVLLCASCCPLHCVAEIIFTSLLDIALSEARGL